LQDVIIDAQWSNSAVSPTRPPTENCQINYGIGGSLFKFDISPYTGLTSVPTLTIKNSLIREFRFEFNSLVDFNDYAGKVVIESSTFEQFQTCSSIIRNKKVAVDKTIGFTPSGANDFLGYYIYRSNQMLY